MTFQPNADGNGLPPPPGNPWMYPSRPPAQHEAPPGRNGFSIAGLVLGILPVFGGVPPRR